MLIEPIILIYLAVLSIIDVKYKGKEFGMIPSALATFFIVLMLFLNGFNSLFGLTTFFLFGIILMELNFYDGGQDLKIIAGLGCIPQSPFFMLIFIGVIVVLGLVYKFLIVKLSEGKLKSVPFIPVFALSYLAYLIVEVLI